MRREKSREYEKLLTDNNFFMISKKQHTKNEFLKTFESSTRKGERERDEEIEGGKSATEGRLITNLI